MANLAEMLKELQRERRRFLGARHPTGGPCYVLAS